MRPDVRPGADLAVVIDDGRVIDDHTITNACQRRDDRAGRDEGSGTHDRVRGNHRARMHDGQWPRTGGDQLALQAFARIRGANGDVKQRVSATRHHDRANNRTP